MTCRWLMLPVLGVLFAAVPFVADADDARDEAIRKDRQQIEGTWRIVTLVVNGNKSAGEDARKLSVVNRADGTWRLLSEGQEVSRGTTMIDPTEKPKRIDIVTSEGDAKGQVHPGIYELGENTRRLCFAPPGKKRPTEFVSAPDSDHIYVVFEREKSP